MYGMHKHTHTHTHKVLFSVGNGWSGRSKEGRKREMGAIERDK